MTRRGEEGTKEKDDERAVATGPQGCSAASCVFVVELMTGLRSQKTTGISALLPGFIHPRSFGNLIPFGLKSPDKTEHQQLI